MSTVKQKLKSFVFSMAGRRSCLPAGRRSVDDHGQVFVFALVIMGLLLVTTVLLLTGSISFLRNANLTIEKIQATNLADAGLDKALAALNATGGSYNGEAETALGTGSYSVSITSINIDTLNITATGYVPNKTKPKAKRSLSIQATKGVGASFTYGMQVGNGGIHMNNNSTINGSVYANGNIDGVNSNTVNGDIYIAGTQSTLDQSADCTAPNCADYFFGNTSGVNNFYDVAQSFKPGSTAVINKVSLKVKKIGSPPSPDVKIVSDNAGKPSKTVIAAGTLNSSLVTSQYGFIDVTFTTTPTLAANTSYWIVVATSALPPYNRTINYWAWSEDVLQTYTAGSSAWSANWQASPNPTWANILGDMGFKTYAGGMINSINFNNSTVGGNVFANTINGSFRINKDAYYQTLSPSVTVSGVKHPNSTDTPPLAFPISDANIQSWKDNAQAAGVTTGDITTCPANLGPGKFVGNFSVASNCTVTVKTPIWITGNFTTGNSPTFNLDSSYGDESGMIVIDGTVNMGNAPSFNGASGHTKSYLFLITTFDSRSNGQTAMTMGNGSVTGVLYAPYGIVSLPNGPNLKELVAYQINMGNGTILNYQTGLSNITFSSGPTGSYRFVKGTYQSK